MYILLLFTKMTAVSDTVHV